MGDFISILNESFCIVNENLSHIGSYELFVCHCYALLLDVVSWYLCLRGGMKRDGEPRCGVANLRIDLKVVFRKALSEWSFKCKNYIGFV